MNEERVKSIAHKIEMTADSIKLRMQALQRNSLADMEDAFIAVNFQDVNYYCEAIQRILADDLPKVHPAAAEREKRGDIRVFSVIVPTADQLDALVDRLFSCGEQGKDWAILPQQDNTYRVYTEQPETAREIFLNGGYAYQEVQ